jgi:hypothetical protein
MRGIDLAEDGQPKDRYLVRLLVALREVVVTADPDAKRREKNLRFLRRASYAYTSAVPLNAFESHEDGLSCTKKVTSSYRCAVPTKRDTFLKVLRDHAGCSKCAPGRRRKPGAVC